MYYDFVDLGFSARAYLLETSYGFFLSQKKKQRKTDRHFLSNLPTKEYTSTHIRNSFFWDAHDLCLELIVTSM
jgi:hypothetical protein